MSWAETIAIEGLDDGWIFDEFDALPDLQEYDSDSDIDSNDDEEADILPRKATLPQPMLNDGNMVTGTNKAVHHIKNKQKRIAHQEEEGKEEINYWRQHNGEFSVPTPKHGPSM